MVAGPKEDGNSRSLTSLLLPNHEVRSSTWPASTQLFRPPSSLSLLFVGFCPAPRAVLILVLLASFWKVVVLIWWSGFFLLNASTAPWRMSCCGSPLRYQ